MRVSTNFVWKLNIFFLSFQLMETSPSGGPGDHAVRRVGMKPRLVSETVPIPHRHLVVVTALGRA